MPLAQADLPFLEVLWSMMVFFAWLAWIWIAITCFADIFRRHDIGGWSKALWIVFIMRNVNPSHQSPAIGHRTELFALPANETRLLPLKETAGDIS